MENYFNQNFTVRNCNVPNCHGQHFIKFKGGKAVIPVWEEMFQIEKYWKKNIERLCGVVCEKDFLCSLQRKLNCFTFFTGNIRQRNINWNDVVSKIVIRHNCRHLFCLNGWCFEIYETEYVTNDKSLSYRATKYL